MTAAPEDKPLIHDRSFLGVGLSAGALLVTGVACRLLSAPPEVVTACSAVAAALPAAISYAAQKRRRDNSADAVELARGQLNRPAPLVIVVYAAALLLLDTIFGIMTSAIGYFPVSFPIFLIGVAGIGIGTAYVSLLLGEHPYRGILIGLGLGFLARLAILSSFIPAFIHDVGAQYLPGFLQGTVMSWLTYLIAVMAGVFFGTRRREAYIASRLAALAPSQLAPSHPAPAASTRQPDSVPADISAPVAPAGWYADPDLKHVERYWNGVGWSDERRNSPEA